MRFHKIIEFSHQLIRERVKIGDTVIDATVGRGKDTAFLAELVGENGKVYGFDVQTESIDYAKQNLKSELADRVEFILDSHENIDKYINQPLKTVIFNLGYLPGSDKKVITKHTSTIKAIESSLNQLNDDGIVVLVVYYEHDKGEEAEGINDFLTSLPQKEYSVIKYQFINQINYPPYVIAIEKTK